MENNSDKHLRDKLTGMEFPFDLQAWAEMEAMLDKKKKRGGFFWWWTGGIAAALLFGVIGYEIGRNDKLSNANYKSEIDKTIDHRPLTNGKAKETTDHRLLTIAETGKAIDHRPLTDAKIRTQNLNEEPSMVNRQWSNSRAVGKHTSKNNHSANLASGKEGEFLYPSKSSNTLAAKTFNKKKTSARLHGKTLNEDVTGNTNAAKTNLLKQEADLLTSAATQGTSAERIEMDKRNGLLESTSNEYSLNKMNEDELPKSKKKIFHYSMGVLGNVTGTTVSKQTGVPLFYNKPSYAVGFTHDFLFLNRVAVTNSILYSQTGFKINTPNAPYDSSSTKNYTSAISELQIPIGIKAYPVAKKHFRVSVSAGIINHIKLKEVFTVEKEPVPYIPNNIVAMDNTFVSVANNPFMNSKSFSSNTFNGTASQSEQAEYYGMGGLRRYYASFYASAGVEFIAQNHFVFFTEPMFYMSLGKIGLQEKRKYNVGVNGGFRYQF